ncbi:MAG: phosphatidylserine/phosphatidylglycerophosphate/cardiolipin synthase family protein [Propionibacterium sp.]|nr:phosphatidylserine/phosphatidylglycerophosphate/cardiolipin synthase family protein [Propionibacterium sp.]
MRRVPARSIIRRVIGAIVAAQLTIVAALQVVAWHRKRRRPPVNFPSVPPVPFDAGDTEVEIFTYGQDLYDDMLAEIRRATDTVFFETFIWKDDAIGRAFKRELIAAADRGVQVYLIWDEFANLVIPQRFFRFPAHVHAMKHPLIGGGVGFLHPGNVGRDHRKILVIDSEVAWVGGYNIGSLYATEWRDTHAKFRGPVVSDIENAFVDFWNMVPKRRPAPLPDVAKRPWHADMRVHRNLPRHFLYPIRGMYLEAMDRATRNIWLTHAYLIPDDDMQKVLRDAVDRGVDVRIIVPAESNHIEADWVSRSYYRALLESGVRLFLYQNAMVHSKTATIDGQWSTIGTANIDSLSLLVNYEINVDITSVEVADKLEEIYRVDLGNCRELTLEEWNRRHPWMKVSEAILRPLRHFL